MWETNMRSGDGRQVFRTREALERAEGGYGIVE